MPFECPTCCSTFPTEAHQKIHLLSHAEESNSSSSLTAADYANPEYSGGGDAIVHLVQTSAAAQPLVAALLDGSNISSEQDSSILDLDSVHDQMNLDTGDPGALSESEFLGLGEDNQLVANLQFLLENGLVTIQTDDGSEEFSGSSPASDAPSDFVTTDGEKENYQTDTSPQVICTDEMRDMMPGIEDANDFQLDDDCMALQMENIDPTICLPMDCEELMLSG